MQSKCKLTMCYKYAWNTEYVICLKFSLQSWQGAKGERGGATNLIIFSKWFLSFFIANFSLLLLSALLSLLLLLLQHFEANNEWRKTCHGLSAFYAKHTNTQRRHRQRRWRWRLVKFSLVWLFFFIFYPLFAVLPSCHFFSIFCFSFYVFVFLFVFTTVWRQFSNPAPLGQPRLALPWQQSGKTTLSVELSRFESSLRRVESPPLFVALWRNCKIDRLQFGGMHCIWNGIVSCQPYRVLSWRHYDCQLQCYIEIYLGFRAWFRKYCDNK